MPTEVLPKPSVKTSTPWLVVVFDDPVNGMDYVTTVFMRVFQHSKATAEKHMLEVHHKGRSVLWSGKRELAEHYVQQLQSYQLHAATEQAE